MTAWLVTGRPDLVARVNVTSAVRCFRIRAAMLCGLSNMSAFSFGFAAARSAAVTAIGDVVTRYTARDIAILRIDRPFVPVQSSLRDSLCVLPPRTHQ